MDTIKDASNNSSTLLSEKITASLQESAIYSVDTCPSSLKKYNGQGQSKLA